MKTLRPALALVVWAALAGSALAQDDYPPSQDYPPPGAPPPAQGPEAPPPGAPPGYAPPPEAAPPPAAAASGGFGVVGQMTISDDLQLVAARHSESLGGQSMSKTTVSLNPAVDYFVAQNFSVGGQLLIGFESNDAGDITTIGLTPRAGYNVPLSPVASLWPRAGIGYFHTSNSYSGTGIMGTSGYRVTLSAFVPVLFQPAPHFFIGGGPFLSTDLVSKFQQMDYTKVTDFGLQSTIGGYFGGP